jgi:hypothetical protein
MQQSPRREFPLERGREVDSQHNHGVIEETECLPIQCRWRRRHDGDGMLNHVDATGPQQLHRSAVNEGS